MAKLNKIWINEYQKYDRTLRSIRMDWDNDRHQSIEIAGDQPSDLLEAMTRAHHLIASEMKLGKI